MNKKASFRVTSVIGHVFRLVVRQRIRNRRRLTHFSLDFPPDYQNREKVDPLTLFQAPTLKKESKPEV